MRSLLCAVAILLLPAPALGRSVAYAVAIGNNAPPERGESGLGPLSYADDDAVRYQQLFERFADESRLLSVLDDETRRRFPQEAQQALPPSLSELERVLSGFAEQMELDRLRGDEPVFYLAFSGHGFVQAEGGDVALSMLDAGLTREWLYERVLARLPARHVHLIVDACHAEAVVGVRGGPLEEIDSRPVKLTAREARQLLEETTLARFPHVGALVATAAGQQSHEWSRIQSGVFTHQLLSGLRGAADVNRDGLIEYSEVQAFISAASRELRDPRAIPRVIAHAPRSNPRAPLVSIRALEGMAYLEGPSPLGHFYVELENGERYLEANLSAGLDARLAVPPGKLFVVAGGREASLGLEAGDSVRLDALSMEPVERQERGSIDTSLTSALFASAYSRTYYLGFADSRGLVAVSFARTPPAASPDRGDESSVASLGALTIAGCSATAALVLTGLMLDARRDAVNTDLQRPALEARDRFVRHRAGAAVAGVAAVGAGLVAWWLWPERQEAPVSVSAGPGSLGLRFATGW